MSSVFVFVSFTAHTLAIFAFSGVGVSFSRKTEPRIILVHRKIRTEKKISLGDTIISHRINNLVYISLPLFLAQWSPAWCLNGQG